MGVVHETSNPRISYGQRFTCPASILLQLISLLEAESTVCGFEAGQWTQREQCPVEQRGRIFVRVSVRTKEQTNNQPNE